MSYHCECEQCKNKEFNPEDYIIKEKDFKVLDEERPLGISGHLRVKDEAMSLAECIDSCIDALDELIITYNKSTDNTEEILKEYAQKYPDKIRLYYYKPNIILYDNNKYLEKFPILHNLCNYYNYGYIKIKYKYYMKIDADQIYFTDKLLSIRKALFKDISKEISELNFYNKLLWFIPIRKIRSILRYKKEKKLLNKILNSNYIDLDKISDIYDLILYYKLIIRKSCYFSLGGINLIKFNNKLCLNTGNLLNGCVGDHSIWIPNSKSKYIMEKNAVTENIHLDDKFHICGTGILWVHLGDIKKQHSLAKGFDVIYYEDINRKENFIYKVAIPMIHMYYKDHFFDNDKKYLTKEFYDRFLKKPLEYAIKNQDKLW
ncbi:hypothetical protein SZ41_07615 [Brachyspira hyodysenteriae]|uniref:glycosyltransferase n=1 Tax=Brachyspira hyodysenteriae TaxID=159 RepID=UPI00063DA5C3|nr:glycosyltransferase [Brachyspira hyodysenteriae]KLI48123.1 hypothetical protein SZ41_07615 [Brachyspira hyodysenteriae]